jgi:glutathione synthase/RimK-type ligase-like ATP-grasp enzyme
VTDVVYVTHELDPDLQGSHVDTDLPHVLAAFGRIGLDVDVATWDDRGYDWSDARLVLVRSPWDYVLRRREFVAWAHDVAALTRIENPADVIETNTDKRYLRTLERAGVPVVPTGWIEPGDDVDAVIAEVREAHGERVVVKPSVSAAARDTLLTADPREAAELARTVLTRGCAVLVQPFVAAVDGEGETSVLVVDGEVTHAVRRAPVLSTAGFSDGLVDVTDELARTALGVVAAAEASELLYARVDLVRSPEGSLQLMELELTEPTLFLDLCPQAADVLARGVAARLG